MTPVHWMNEKCTAKLTEGESTQCKKKYCMIAGLCSMVSQLGPILFSVLPVLDVFDFCIINIILYMSPELKKNKDFYQRHGQAMLLVRLVASIAPETCPRIPELEEGTVVEYHFA
jgi:hypothetical protein